MLTRISKTKIILDEIVTFLSFPEHGAQILFTGVVRDHNLGKRVLAVSYDAFAPLAEKTFQEICVEIKSKWGADIKLAIVHRVGRLKVGELSVAIGVGSCHRDEAYQASRYAIEN